MDLHSQFQEAQESFLIQECLKVKHQDYTFEFDHSSDDYHSNDESETELITGLPLELIDDDELIQLNSSAKRARNNQSKDDIDNENQSSESEEQINDNHVLVEKRINLQQNQVMIVNSYKDECDVIEFITKEEAEPIREEKDYCSKNQFWNENFQIKLVNNEKQNSDKNIKLNESISKGIHVFDLTKNNHIGRIIYQPLNVIKSNRIKSVNNIERLTDLRVGSKTQPEKSFSEHEIYAIKKSMFENHVQVEIFSSGEVDRIMNEKCQDVDILIQEIIEKRSKRSEARYGTKRFESLEQWKEHRKVARLISSRKCCPLKNYNDHNYFAKQPKKKDFKSNTSETSSKKHLKDQLKFIRRCLGQKGKFVDKIRIIPNEEMKMQMVNTKDIMIDYDVVPKTKWVMKEIQFIESVFDLPCRRFMSERLINSYKRSIQKIKELKEREL